MFSEFGKNIAPTYYHDRCEKTGPFLLHSPAVSTFSQQLWVIARIILKNGDDERFNKPFHIAVTIHGVSDMNKIVVVLGEQHNHNRTRELRCFNSCWFAYSFEIFFFFDWSIEQKWISVLLPLLVLYNDPVFPLSFLVNSWVPGLLMLYVSSYIFVCTASILALHIIMVLDRMNEAFTKFYLPKCIIIGSLWLSAFTLASWQKYNEMRDPTYNYKVDTGHFMGFKVFFFTIGSVYLVYLFYLIIRAYTELRSMPYLHIAITVLRFGISVLQDNFVAELSTNYGSSAEFMSFYSLLNFYLVTMAYVYAPPRGAYFETRVKDNPTLSMINDSDEEVIYASDSENRPLNPTRKTPDKEESD
ncbi:transmembrane protein 181 [Caerostris extrusa]|uniref:Transmembrane protein 181 n=1 Tax=Caerostris extrusa TaxID=172846 RepID=A0AAV4XHN6_CAEEX|nr:transmembrane protein 181 [Caerostris extrusa]